MGQIAHVRINQIHLKILTGYVQTVLDCLNIPTDFVLTVPDRLNIPTGFVLAVLDRSNYLIVSAHYEKAHLTGPIARKTVAGYSPKSARLVANLNWLAQSMVAPHLTIQPLVTDQSQLNILCLCCSHTDNHIEHMRLVTIHL
jgi:hypothetical protein